MCECLKVECSVISALVFAKLSIRFHAMPPIMTSLLGVLTEVSFKGGLLEF